MAVAGGQRKSQTQGEGGRKRCRAIYGVRTHKNKTWAPYPSSSWHMCSAFAKMIPQRFNFEKKALNCTTKR